MIFPYKRFVKLKEKKSDIVTHNKNKYLEIIILLVHKQRLEEFRRTKNENETKVKNGNRNNINSNKIR